MSYLRRALIVLAALAIAAFIFVVLQSGPPQPSPTPAVAPTVTAAIPTPMPQVAAEPSQTPKPTATVAPQPTATPTPTPRLPLHRLPLRNHHHRLRPRCLPLHRLPLRNHHHRLCPRLLRAQLRLLLRSRRQTLRLRLLPTRNQHRLQRRSLDPPRLLPGSVLTASRITGLRWRTPGTGWRTRTTRRWTTRMCWLTWRRKTTILMPPWRPTRT